MQPKADVTDEYLALQAARRVQESCLCRLEAAFIYGSLAEVEMSMSGYMDASETVTDRVRDLVFAQMRKDGIDPVTRRLM